MYNNILKYYLPNNDKVKEDIRYKKINFILFNEI
jgi:hypothetical protein